MRQVQLPDKLFDEVEQVASASGFSSVDEYVFDILTNSIHAQNQDFDSLFTPERLAIIDKASAEVEEGQTHTEEEVDEHFRQKLRDWPKAS